MSTRNLFLVRHCQATGQHPNAPLTETGHQQAQSLARFLSDYPIDFIVASQYLRARQSIGPYATAKGISIHQDERFNERILSAEPVEHWQEIVRDSFDERDLRAPGGESANEVLCRAWAALDELIDAGHEFPLVVTHGNLMAVVLHSLDPEFGFEGWKSLTNPDVFALVDAGSVRMTFERIWNG